MTAASVDTSVLMRLVLRDMPSQYSQATKLVQSSKSLHVSDMALLEMAYALRHYYEFDRQTVADAINGVLNEPRFNCNRALFDNALPLYVKYPKLSLADCCLASYAMFNDAEPLWTFDKKMANQLHAAKLVS